MNENSNNSFYLLNLKENYLDELLTNEIDLMNEFHSVLVDYINYAIDSIHTITFNNINLSKFLLIRGIDTLCHVFLNLLYHTNNSSLVLYHCQKSFYFYIEFVSQIAQDDKSFLQLNSKDAVLYVYKKTIYEIDYNIKSNKLNKSPETREKIEVINLIIDIYKSYLYSIINSDIFYKDYKVLMSNYHNIISILLYGNGCLTLFKIKKIYYIINYLITNIHNIDIVCERSLIFLKIINNNKEVLEHTSEDMIISELIC
jgi:hypothetical protein